MQQRAYDLMKRWCDKLLSYRVSLPDRLLDGALLCPACHIVHGRIADLTFPLTQIYVRSGEGRYLEAADRLIDWSEENLSRPDGSWRNDATNEWKGISAFSALALGEALMRYDSALPQALRDKWHRLFVKLSDYINGPLLAQCNPNINYYAGVACEQAMAWRLTGEACYLEYARQAEAFCRAHFDEDGLFYGEKTPVDQRTPKGARPIDMGYNLEESLPLLVHYAQLTGEDEAFYRERFRDHLAFLLPDGAIDNSWGSRHNKWSWWGSRTSDGALSGLALLCDEPLFAEACERVLFLYERCTHEDLLALPMASQAGEPTCLHHSFCHAKALAMLADAPAIAPLGTPLPCEAHQGLRFYQNGTVALMARRPWRATVSACDLVYAPGCENGGGSMTLLMKDRLPICASTMRVYQPMEPLNMQFLRRCDQTPCMTPRLCFDEGGDNLLDLQATLTPQGEAALRAQGRGWEISYAFGEAVTLSVRSDRPATFILPVIAHGPLRMEPDAAFIGPVCVRAPGLRVNPAASGFNQVGGFIWQTLEIPVRPAAVIEIR